MIPRAIELARTPLLPSSLAIPFNTCSIVAFGATDKTSPGGYLNKPAELMNTIDPLDSRKYGKPDFIKLKNPLISASITLFHRSISISAINF